MQPIQAIASAATLTQPEASASRQAVSSFGSVLGNLMTETQAQQVQADQAIQQLHTGTGEHLHEAMISMEKADISMRYMIQVRNKAIEAYQEIMRMQV